MYNSEFVKIKYQSLELDVAMSSKQDIFWLTKEQIALLFNRDRSVISRHLKIIYKTGELDKSTCVHFLHITPNEKQEAHRPPELYNLEAVLAVGRRVKNQEGLELKEWFEKYISNKDNEIIVYKNGVIQLDVRVEPMNDTVWLNANQVATLFDTSRDNIYLHIKNIYEDREIDYSVTEDSSDTRKENVQISSNGK